MTPKLQSDISQQYLDFLARKEFPCIGAKAALAKHEVRILTADHMACPHDDRAILEYIYSFVDDLRLHTPLYSTAAVIFVEPGDVSEADFGKLFWKRLQAISDLDAAHYAYDPRVASDPERADFSFSVKEEAFYVVGLHPMSSRKARQFSFPAMIFNPHAQFDRLKQMGKYESMKNVIRNRDLRYSGSVNPMLADFGESSEVLQYTGIKYDNDWKCPFIARHADHPDHSTA